MTWTRSGPLLKLGDEIVGYIYKDHMDLLDEIVRVMNTRAPDAERASLIHGLTEESPRDLRDIEECSKKLRESRWRTSTGSD